MENSSGRITVFPLHALGRLIVVADVSHQLLCEIFDRREDAPRDDIALHLGEPELDLVEPRGVRRREM